MKRAPTDKPNLDDVLARDFAELKVGEANLKAAPETPADETAASESEQTTPAVPKAYNQRINAVEDREAFSVKAPKATAGEEAQTTSFWSSFRIISESGPGSSASNSSDASAGSSGAAQRGTVQLCK